MQTMRDQQQLIKLQIDLGAAFRGVGLVKKILFVSHGGNILVTLILTASNFQR